jgi:hypothetical protein
MLHKSNPSTKIEDTERPFQPFMAKSIGNAHTPTIAAGIYNILKVRRKDEKI